DEEGPAVGARLRLHQPAKNHGQALGLDARWFHDRPQAAGARNLRSIVSRRRSPDPRRARHPRTLDDARRNRAANGTSVQALGAVAHARGLTREKKVVDSFANELARG